MPIAAISRDTLYVVNGEDSTISVVDPAGGTLMGTITLKNVRYPHHIYLSPDHTRLAVAVPGRDLSGGHAMRTLTEIRHDDRESGGASTSAPGGAVLVLEASTGSMINARRLDAPNHNAIFSRDGREIWTAQLVEDGVVLVLDASTLETRQTVRVGKVPAEVTFSRDGKYAFVANGMSDDVSVIDASTKALVKTLPVDRQPVGAWPGADGMMYVDCEVAKTVKAIDATALEVVRTYALGFTPGSAAVPPGRPDELWITDVEAGSVVFFDKTGARKIGDVVTGPGAHALVFTPDGTTAFVTNQTDDSLSFLEPKSHRTTRKLRVGKKPNGMVLRTM